MINEKELLISGKSYINKDFSSIYPEQVDIFKTLTNRYDPETSNESDPGIVLMKTNAFVTDKLCYNIDKNVLENYMPSATQESSMSDLCARLGYEMKYYIASATDIYIKYTGNAFDNEDANSFIIPQFTEISTSNGDIVFVTTERREYTKKDDYITIPAIQGNVHTLNVADSDIIRLENLNNQNRIYFSESMVAQNGIFVTSVDSIDGEKEWYITNNLNLELPNSRCFKFGYDSVKRWPYLEFPSDIASLIGSGLKIEYVVTSGESGNVKASALTNITNYSSFDILNKDGENVTDESGNVTVKVSNDENSELVIKNTSASIGGANPESINEAYNNFKRTIGTFDTLVTCRDYANAIYNLYDENNIYPVVSNVQVSDRRDDINYSNKILTLDKYGTKYIYGNNDITAFDLCLYPLKAITSYTDKDYIESFKPKNNLTYIVDSLENGKTISHDYKELDADDIYAIKNKYKLNVKLTTTYKVTQYERVSIIANVLSAIIKKFNAREVDYGEEIPYETILETIQNADERINFVSLAEPVQTTYFMSSTGVETPLTDNSGRSEYLNLLAKNILAGKVSLFNLYDMFNFEFNQTEGEVKNKLKKIYSEAKITLTEGTEYKLQENEVIQIVGPSFVTTIPYAYGVRYHYDGQQISKDSEYQLKSGESLTVRYKQSGHDDYTIITYTEGEIIKPNFELVDTEDTTSGTVVVDGINYAMIQANEQIDIRKLNESSLTGFTYCYWLRNTENNALFTENDRVGTGDDAYYETMLQDGEYFFYKTSLKDDFISLGSGTILRVNNSLGSQTTIWTIKDTITIEDILNKGSDAIKWKQIIFDSTNKLNIQETTILTLTAQDTIKFSDNQSGSSTIEIDNDLEGLDIDVDIQYTFSDGTSKHLEKIDYNSSDNKYKWKIKSRLDINAGPNLAQYIDSKNNSSIHKIKFTMSDDTTYPGGDNDFFGTGSYTGYSFKLNEKQQFVGSANIVASALDIATNLSVYPLSVYVYQNSNTGISIETHRNELGFVNVYVNGNAFIYTDSETEFTPNLILPLKNNKCILTIYYDKMDSGISVPTLTSIGESGSGIRIFNSSTEYDSALPIEQGINVVEISSGVESIAFSGDNESGSTLEGILSIGKLTYLDNENEFNSVFNLKSGESTLLLNALNSVDVNHQFFYNHDVTKDNLIDVDDLSEPHSLYEYNNVANKFTISEIDISNSDIDIVKTSQL